MARLLIIAQAAIKLNPYQGLKLDESLLKLEVCLLAAIKLNPYQGLKHLAVISSQCTSARRN